MNKERLLELKVGIFVLLGMLVIAIMAFRFGKMGEQAKTTYDLIVDLPDASGILKGSDVQLAGARVGFVSEKPQIAANVGSVAVKLKINDEVKIPKQTRFQVGSSGLLGDVFVKVVPSPEFDPESFNPDDPSQRLNPGDRIKGSRASGLEDLTQQGAVVMEKLQAELTEIQVLTKKLHEDLLSDKNMRNMEATFENLKTTSATFVETSKNLNAVVQNAQGAVETAQTTMTTANSAAADLRLAIGDFRKVADSARGLIQLASRGDGLIPRLLNDRQMADNLSALIANMRQRGVLFYKDNPPREPRTPPAR